MPQPVHLATVSRHSNWLPLSLAGEVRIGIFAIRDITPGEELTYDYQFQHSGLAGAAGAYRRDEASACTSYMWCLGCSLALFPAIHHFMLELLM